MKHHLWASLLLGCVGCSAPNLSQSHSPDAVRLHNATSQTTQVSILAQAPSSQPTADRSTIQQDYAATAPLPSTGQVTVRDHIRNLDSDRLIVDCPADSAPYAFAESTNFEVQICSEEYDPWQPKYYISQAKDRSSGLRITSSNPEEARQLIFRNKGYTYVIYRDGARPDQQNAYLEVYTPDGDNFAEALLYLYEAGPAPRES
jgi:hypothetical protein